jgi:cytochrome b pre-mRNA-processing protein 3
MLDAFRRRNERRRHSQALAAALVERARTPLFYEELQVADTIDGRFDILVLHAWLALDILATRGEREFSQALTDCLFTQFDEALRQQGAGDIGMGRRMSKMADAFFGRLKAYSEAGDEKALAEAVLRNVYRGDASKVEPARALAIYAAAARARLADLDLMGGTLDFGPLSSCKL